MDVIRLVDKLRKKDVSPAEAEFVFKSCFDFVNGRKDLKEPLTKWFSVLFDAVGKGRRGNFLLSVPLRFDFSRLGLESCLSALPYSFRIAETAGDNETMKKLGIRTKFVRDGRAVAFFDRAGEFAMSHGRPQYTEVRHDMAGHLARQAMSFRDTDLKSRALIEILKKGFFAEKSCCPEEIRLFVRPDIKRHIERALDIPKKEYEKALLSLAVAAYPEDGLSNTSLCENGDMIYYNDGRMLYVFTKDRFDEALLQALEPEEIMR